MRAACSRVLPRRLVTAPLRSRSCRNPSGCCALARRPGLSAPPLRSVRSPPPVRCSSPLLTRPVDPTAATIALECGAVNRPRALPIGSSTPAWRPASSERLPPPSVPKPVKPTMRGAASASAPTVLYVPKLIHQLVGVACTPSVVPEPCRHNQPPTAALECPAWSRCAVPDSDRAVQASPMMSRPASTLTSPPWSGYHAR